MRPTASLNICLFLVAVLFQAKVFAQLPNYPYAGIPRHKMEYVAAAQENSQWCWAASIQMVLNYYGVDINQRQIVARTFGTGLFGTLPNRPASDQVITANLNNWSIDNRGRRYIVNARHNGGAPNPEWLLNELQQKRPIVVGYVPPGANQGHAVVITAASYSYSPTFVGPKPVIHSIVVRDPFPTQQNIYNRGRVEYSGAQFASRMRSHWFVRVTPAPW